VVETALPERPRVHARKHGLRVAGVDRPHVSALLDVYRKEGVGMTEELTYSEAVRRLAELAQWSDVRVKDEPREASFVAYARVAQWRTRVELGDR
jgi:hypothetical protein